MNKPTGAYRIYTVVDVVQGVAAGAYSYRRIQDAQACVKRLRHGRDMQEDDVNLFEGFVDATDG